MNKFRYTKVGAILLVSLFLGSCSSIGHSFKSDSITLSQLVVGETTPDDAVRILGGNPYIRQNLSDGTIAWSWQRIAVGPFVHVTDNRLLSLQFKSSDGGKTWQFYRVIHAQNVDLPVGLPFGSVVN